MITWLAANPGNQGWRRIDGGAFRPATFLYGFTCATQTDRLWANASISPSNDDSTLQSEAVLIVVVAADGQGTVVAKAGVEIFKLGEAYGKFLVDLDIKTPTHRQRESVLGVSAAAGGCEAIQCGALARERGADPAEVELAKWLEFATISEGQPWPEQVGKKISVNRVAEAVRVTEYFAATQVSSYANQTGHVVLDRTAAASAIYGL